MSKLLGSILLICLCLSSQITGQEDGEGTAARLLFSKQIHNRYLVESKDVLVQYGLYNHGETPATDIRVQDSSFPQEDFDLVAGSLAVKIDRIPPGGNMTFDVVVRPKSYGYYNFSTAQVLYLATPKAPESTVGFSSLPVPTQGFILPLFEYDKRFSSHFIDWMIFLVLCTPSLGIPFLLWWTSASKYESIARQGRKGKIE